MSEICMMCAQTPRHRVTTSLAAAGLLRCTRTKRPSTRLTWSRCWSPGVLRSLPFCWVTIVALHPHIKHIQTLRHTSTLGESCWFVRYITMYHWSWGDCWPFRPSLIAHFIRVTASFPRNEGRVKARRQGWQPHWRAKRFSSTARSIQNRHSTICCANMCKWNKVENLTRHRKTRQVMTSQHIPCILLRTCCECCVVQRSRPGDARTRWRTGPKSWWWGRSSKTSRIETFEVVTNGDRCLLQLIQTSLN